MEAYGRLYLVHRDYKAPFSGVYPYKRKDTQLRLTGGLEKRLDERFSLFGEAGYARNNSNVRPAAMTGSSAGSASCSGSERAQRATFITLPPRRSAVDRGSAEARPARGTGDSDTATIRRRRGR